MCGYNQMCYLAVRHWMEPCPNQPYSVYYRITHCLPSSGPSPSIYGWVDLLASPHLSAPPPTHTLLSPASAEPISCRALHPSLCRIAPPSSSLASSLAIPRPSSAEPSPCYVTSPPSSFSPSPCCVALLPFCAWAPCPLLHRTFPREGISLRFECG